MTEPLHILLATFEACDQRQIDDRAAIEKLLGDAVSRAGFTLLQISAHGFEPQGVTGMAIVGESHLAIHTWPETGSLFFEAVSCGGREMTTQALEAIEEGLGEAVLTQLQQIEQLVPQRMEVPRG